MFPHAFTSTHKELDSYIYSGILAGIWPCGTITLLAELFISESKAQVYGAVHDFLRSNPDSTGGISKWWLSERTRITCTCMHVLMHTLGSVNST